MSLSAGSRANLYGKLHEIGVSETTLEELLSCLPRNSYEAPITQTQMADRDRATAAEHRERLNDIEQRLYKRLEIANSRFDTRIDSLDERLDIHLKSMDKRFDIRLNSTNDQLTTLRRDRLEEQTTVHGMLGPIIPFLLAVVAVIAVIALSLAVRTEKKLDGSDDARGAQVTDLADTPDHGLLLISGDRA